MNGGGMDTPCTLEKYDYVGPHASSRPVSPTQLLMQFKTVLFQQSHSCRRIHCTRTIDHADGWVGELDTAWSACQKVIRLLRLDLLIHCFSCTQQTAATHSHNFITHMIRPTVSVHSNSQTLNSPLAFPSSEDLLTLQSLNTLPLGKKSRKMKYHLKQLVAVNVGHFQQFFGAEVQSFHC